MVAMLNDFYRIAPLMSVSGKSANIACSATVAHVARNYCNDVEPD